MSGAYIARRRGVIESRELNYGIVRARSRSEPAACTTSIRGGDGHVVNRTTTAAYNGSMTAADDDGGGIDVISPLRRRHTPLLFPPFSDVTWSSFGIGLSCNLRELPLEEKCCCEGRLAAVLHFPCDAAPNQRFRWIAGLSPINEVTTNCAARKKYWPRSPKLSSPSENSGVQEEKPPPPHSPSLSYISSRRAFLLPFFSWTSIRVLFFYLCN